MLSMPLPSQKHTSLAGSWGASSVLSIQPHLKTRSDLLHAGLPSLVELPTGGERLCTYRQADQTLPSERLLSSPGFYKEDNQVGKMIGDSGRWESNV